MAASRRFAVHARACSCRAARAGTGAVRERVRSATSAASPLVDHVGATQPHERSSSQRCAGWSSLSSTTRTRQTREAAPAPRARRGRALLLLEGHLEVERAALARLALDPDLAAHQLDQPAADGEAEARAAVAAGRRAVGLREALEDEPPGWSVGMPMPVSRTARRISERASSSRSATSAVDVTATSPRSVNLMALPTRLSSTCRMRSGVADRCRPGSVGRHVAGELEPLVVGARARAVFSAPRSSCSRRSKRHRLEVELARLDLREVEDVVDDRQQRLAGASGSCSTNSRCSAVELGVQRAARSCR